MREGGGRGEKVYDWVIGYCLGGICLIVVVAFETLERAEENDIGGGTI